MEKPDERDEQARILQLQRQADEGRTFLTDHMPNLWRGLYERLQVLGFAEEQAFSLVRTYILAQAPAGVHVHKG